jgi:uncharacterized protein
MGKFLFWIVVAFGVLLALRLAGAAAAKRRRDAGAATNGARSPAETMVRCRRCGVYLPRDDALPAADGFVCADPACAQRR